MAGQVGESGTLGGSALASWAPLWTLLGGFAVIVVALGMFGRSDPRWGGLRVLSRAPNSLERLTKIPGWAAVAVGTSLVGLLVAGEGFYSDVSWHIAFGRDDELLTAPHAGILAGLILILGGAVLGTLVATLDEIPDARRIGGLRVPRSLLPLWALGLGAVAGFPADEVWHRAYGIDVTMWSPTHMLMILGATFTPLALWIVLADSGVTPRSSAWGRGAHVVCAWLTLQGLVAPLGEFTFGVPQFSQLFAPVLLCLAAGIGLVAARVVLGRWWTLGIVAASLLLMGGGDGGPVDTRHGGTFAASALWVELAGRLVGTERRLRFALVSGVGIGTVGLAGEWWWNQDAYQRWTTNLLPEAVILGTAMAIAGAVLGAVIGQGVARDTHVARRIPAAVVGLAAVAAIGVIGLLLPRASGGVTAAVHLEPAGNDRVHVVATVTPVDAAKDAYWFQVTAWQGGGLELADMEPTGQPGEYRSDQAMAVDGYWKTLLRLHRNGEMMAIPIYLPADPSIDEPEIPAVDRTAPFESERRYLLRETHDGNRWLSPAVHAFLALVCATWAAAFVLALRRRDPDSVPQPDHPRETPRPASARSAAPVADASR